MYLYHELLDMEALNIQWLGGYPNHMFAQIHSQDLESSPSLTSKLQQWLDVS